MTGCVAYSFHDLAPHSLPAAERFLDLVRAAGGGPAGLLVVPRWHGAPPPGEDDPFWRRLRAWQDEGHEIVLHGYEHRAPAPRRWSLPERMVALYSPEAEFHRLAEPEAAGRLAEGCRLLRRAGLRCDGFTPPAWLPGPHLDRLLPPLGLAYYTTLTHVVGVGPRRARAAPAITWSSRSGWRRAVSRRWVRAWPRGLARLPLLRIDVHPEDFRHPRVVASIAALVRETAAGRRSTTVADWLGRSRSA